MGPWDGDETGGGGAPGGVRLGWTGHRAVRVQAARLGRRPMPVQALWLVGEPPREGPRVGVVGARAASPEQLAATRAVVRGLIEGGALVVSGGALGVDGAAHRAALAGRAPTLVALPAGLDRPTPAGHLGLFAAVLDGGGALISREAPGFRVRSGAYGRRNAVVAAMVDALVVVCAAHRSGTMITARMAAGHELPIYAVPWSPGTARADGSNRLLATGARAIWGEPGGLALARRLGGRPELLARMTAPTPPGSIDGGSPRIRDTEASAAASLPFAPRSADAPRGRNSCPLGGRPQAGERDPRGLLGPRSTATEAPVDDPAGGWQRSAPRGRRSLTVPPGGDPAVVAAIDGALAERAATGLSIEELVARTAYPRAQLASAVLNLLMESQLRRAGFGRYVRSD